MTSNVLGLQLQRQDHAKKLVSLMLNQMCMNVTKLINVVIIYISRLCFIIFPLPFTVFLPKTI